MARRASIALLLALAACTTPSADPGGTGTPTTATSERPHRVLFVGNSYLYYNDSLHNHTARIAREHGGDERFVFKSSTLSGGRLDQHEIGHLLDPKRLGMDAPFELVVLQGASFETLTARSQQRLALAAARLAQQARETGARVALYMTPAYAPGHARYRPDLMRTIERGYVELGRTLAAPVIPVGLAFERALLERPKLGLHVPFDHSHPNLPGTYLAACVTFATIYGECSTGTKYDYFGAIDSEDAAFLQRIADATVAEFTGRELRVR